VKLVVAIIKPFKLDDVREAAAAIGISGMTVTEVGGCGRQKGQTEIYRGAEYRSAILPTLKVELLCGDRLVERAVDAVRQAARTGTIGDGKIFVLAIEELVRIRTGETNEAAA